jgi:hypothetical protein
MRSLALVALAGLVVVGCAKKDKPADTVVAAPAPAPAPPPPAAITLADVAGTWNMVTKNAAGDSTLLTYVLVAKADTTGWTITFPKRAPVAMKVLAVAGDSIVVHAGPYPSALRKGVQVTTHGVMRLQDGKLVGSTKATYNVKTADSVRMLKMEGTKAP